MAVPSVSCAAGDTPRSRSVGNSGCASFVSGDVPHVTRSEQRAGREALRSSCVRLVRPRRVWRVGYAAHLRYVAVTSAGNTKHRRKSVGWQERRDPLPRQSEEKWFLCSYITVNTAKEYLITGWKKNDMEWYHHSASLVGLPAGCHHQLFHASLYPLLILLLLWTYIYIYIKNSGLSSQNQFFCLKAMSCQHLGVGYDNRPLCQVGLAE